MLKDLDLTLANLLRQKVPLPVADYDISFDRPDEKWAGGISTQKQTVNLYLYDIHENKELWNNEPVLERRADGVVTLKPPPVRVNCIYLITAWSPATVGTALEEHHLLSQVLSTVLRYPTIPYDVLHGQLLGQEPPLPVVAAQPDGPKNPGEFWTAVGNKMKPSISLVVTVGFTPAELDAGPMVTTKVAAYEQRGFPETREEMLQIGGRVVEAGNPDAGVAGATVTVKERGLYAVTDEGGYFKFSGLARGAWTIKAEAGGRSVEVVLEVPAPDGEYIVVLG